MMMMINLVTISHMFSGTDRVIEPFHSCVIADYSGVSCLNCGVGEQKNMFTMFTRCERESEREREGERNGQTINPGGASFLPRNQPTFTTVMRDSEQTTLDLPEFPPRQSWLKLMTIVLTAIIERILVDISKTQALVYSWKHSVYQCASHDWWVSVDTQALFKSADRFRSWQRDCDRVLVSLARIRNVVMARASLKKSQKFMWSTAAWHWFIGLALLKWDLWDLELWFGG